MRQKYFIFSLLSMLTLGLADNSRGPLYPEILNEFSLSNSRGSLFFSVSSAMSFVGGYLTQHLIDRWGVKRSLILGMSFLAMSQLGYFFATSFQAVLFFAVFLGLSFGVLGVTQNVAVIQAAPHHQLQKWQSGLHSMYGLASLMAPTLISTWSMLHAGWRTNFLVIAILTLGIIFAQSWYRLDESILHSQAHSEHPHSKKAERIFFATILAIYVMLELMVSTRLAIYVRSQLGYTFEQGTQMTLLFFLFLFMGRMVFTFWTPPLSLRAQMILSMVFSFAFILFGILVHPIGLSLSGLAMAPFYPLAMTAVGRLFPKDVQSVTSYVIALAGVTVVSMHSLIGIMADRVGIQLALLIGSLGAVFSLLMILFYSRFFQRRIP